MIIMLISIKYFNTIPGTSISGVCTIFVYLHSSLNICSFFSQFEIDLLKIARCKRRETIFISLRTPYTIYCRSELLALLVDTPLFCHPVQSNSTLLCNSNEIGNEYHYFFQCRNVKIAALRTKYIPKYYTKYPSLHKMYGLFSLCNVKVMRSIAMFIRKLEKLL